MLIKKKSFIYGGIIICVSLLLTAVLFNYILPKPMLHCDYPYYPDVESITTAADVIVVGEVIESGKVEKIVVDVTPNKQDKESTPYTISKVKIVNVLKGDVCVGDIIEVKQLGDYKSMPEETLHKMDGYLKTDKSSLMFLCEFENSPYSAVNPAQGIIEVKEDGVLYSTSKYSLWGYTDVNVSESTNANKQNNDTLDNVIDLIKKNVIQEKDSN